MTGPALDQLRRCRVLEVPLSEPIQTAHRAQVPNTTISTGVLLIGLTAIDQGRLRSSFS
jgi:hypothetical protein